MNVCSCAQTIGLATCLRISTCFDYMFQNNSLLNNTTWACSFKIKRVFLRGLKDICLSRRHETQSSGMFRPAWGAASAWGCFGLFCCFGCFGLLRLHPADGTEMAAIVRDLAIGFPMVGHQAGSISAWLPNLS